MDYLKPFLNVIHSEETSGPIKGAALSSIDKFLTYGFLSEYNHNYQQRKILIKKNKRKHTSVSKSNEENYRYSCSL